MGRTNSGQGHQFLTVNIELAAKPGIVPKLEQRHVEADVVRCNFFIIFHP
jgi:hypothetical protein